MPRPFVLDPLFRSIKTLSGIGPRNSVLIEKLIGGPRIMDILWHAPTDVIDRRFSPKIKDLSESKIVTLDIFVEKHAPNTRKGMPYKIKCRDDTGSIILIFFHARKEWLIKQLPEGERRVISGHIDFYHGTPQMVHPDYIVLPKNRPEIDICEPIYPLTAGVTNKLIRKALASALTSLPQLPEWIDNAHKTKEGWSDWSTCIKSLHLASEMPPPKQAPLSSLKAERNRLAYDELLANQLTLSLLRNRQRQIKGQSFPENQTIRQKIMDGIAFDLTGAQRNALQEIDIDMDKPSRMLRLLQGDVGSGKTVVATLAMMNAVGAGSQAALMAPTEILARQHAETLEPWLKPLGIDVVTLTGRDKGRERDAILDKIKDGSAQIVIGTHALFQGSINFKSLGMAVIDEQHRFGVQQRLRLSEKGKGVDILVMTATPIPRSLSLTAYGDMDVSVLDEKPPGRQPIDTRLFAKDKIDSVIEGIKRKIQSGARVYWVCPLVEESELLNVSAAEERYDVLNHIFPSRTGLIHGRMKAQEKDNVMERFITGDIDILVATTVIEVGVNVPEATIMVIEHAERFGLAQLHQLRGRVGRGQNKSYCFLLYAGPLSQTAKERLSIMRQTEDGFLIAEKDLELRGSGDILGTRQSGLPTFKVADPIKNKDLLITANKDAKMILHTNPNLDGERGEALRTLLYLFEQDQAIKYLTSG